MNANEYQKLAARTINKKLYPEDLEFHALFGMVSEVGEIYGIFQKTYQGHGFDSKHVRKELGDLLWFIAEYCTVMDWNLGDVMQENIDKLKQRYPDGFGEERSLNRDPEDI